MAVGGPGFEQMLSVLQIQGVAAIEQMTHAFQADVGEQIGLFEILAVLVIDHGGT
jgi:hypothetical protein